MILTGETCRRPGRQYPRDPPLNTTRIFPHGSALLIAILLATPHLAVVSPASSVVASGVDSLSTAYGSQRKIAVDSLGDIFVTYVKSTNNLTEVFLAESRDQGTTWSDAGQVSLSSNASARSAVAVDEKDRVDLVWTQGIGYASQIYFRSFSQGSFSTPVRLSQLKWYSGFPSIAVDSRSGVHVVWYGFDGTNYEIYYAENRGDSWSEAQKISIGVFDSVNPSIAVDGQDRLHVVWYQEISRHYQVWYREYNGSWNNPEIIGASGFDSYDPSIAVNPSGVVHIVWARQGNQTLNIFYSHSTSQGWSEPIQLSSQGWSQNPSITANSRGGLDVFWWTANGTAFMSSYHGSWSPENVFASNAFFPNAKWSFFHDGAPEATAVVYLSKSGTTYDLLFSRLMAGENDLIPTVVLIAVVSIAAVFVVFWSYSRKRASHVTHAPP